MVRENDIRSVSRIAARVSLVVSGLTWYGFGSCFLGTSDYQDIDVLVVCRSIADALLVRYLVQKISDLNGLHLLIMTYEEEQETEFIVRQCCLAIDLTPHTSKNDHIS